MAKSSRSISARVLAESHFDLQRIRATRYEVFLTIGDFENANGDDQEALNEMDKISRYETTALSKTSGRILAEKWPVSTVEEI
jgi:hypothetical protein